jgi:carbon monoxide dehydrogenase subunit G
MPRYETTVHTPRPAPDVFDYLSDFSTTAEWDPGVTAARRLDSGPLGPGSRFSVTASFLGRDAELEYSITDYEPQRRVVLRGENATTVSLDEITFEPEAGGTLVGYSADLQLKGPLRVLHPVLGVVFKRIGDRAAGGLRRRLAA